MKDFIETVPQPRRRVVDGRRDIGEGIALTVGRQGDRVVILSFAAHSDGSVSKYPLPHFYGDAATLRNLAAACTELADVLDEQQEGDK